MDEDFDLYGDADIYGTTEVKEDEEQQKRTLEQLNANPASASSTAGASSTVPAPSRPADGANTNQQGHQQQSFPPQQQQSGFNGGSSGQYGAQYNARPQQQGFSSYPQQGSGDPSEPSVARVGLAGRPKVVDPNVQNAVYVGELDWWVSDEELRRIANDIGIPIRLSDVTFSEHKVNGKSKGLAFVETADEDEARRLKTWFESNDINHKRATVSLATSANGNPFKTLPKDPPPRENRPMRGGGRGGMAMGAREGRRDGGGNLPMAGAPIRMGGQNGQGGNMAAAAMMNPMMMGMMGGGGGRGGFGRGGGRPPMGMGHFNPNFFGGGGGGGRGGYNNNNNGGDDRDRKRYRSDDNY